jgi:hypothetical protein
MKDAVGPREMAAATGVNVNARVPRKRCAVRRLPEPLQSSYDEVGRR